MGSGDEPASGPERPRGALTAGIQTPINRQTGGPDWCPRLAEMYDQTRFEAALAVAGFDTSVEEAAQDLGARPATVFMRITLPLIAPAVAAGWLLSFTLSLDDLVIASFTSGPGSTTLPMKIFSSVRLGVTPEINAIATILIGLVATGAVVYSLMLKRAVAQRNRVERAMKG